MKTHSDITGGAESPPVQAVDELGELEAAIAKGKARAAAVQAKGHKTLLDEISPEDFANWDGSDEMAIVGKLKKKPSK